MVRAHGLRDLESQEASAPTPQPQQRVMTLGGDGSGTGPLPEMHQIIAPKFKYASFIFLVTIIEIVVFLTELVVNFMEEEEFISKWNPGVGPSSATLKLMRAANRGLIQNGDVDRLIIPVFLHANVIHIFMNLGVTTMFCYRMEEAWGTLRTGIVYLFTGFTGCCFSAALTSGNSLSVGASGAICGMIAAQLIHLLMIWNSGTEIDKSQRQMRACNLGCISMMMVIFGLMSSIGGRQDSADTFNRDNTDHFGHFGGLLGGLFYALVLPAKVENPMECLQGSYIPFLGAFGLLALVGGSLLSIFM